MAFIAALRRSVRARSNDCRNAESGFTLVEVVVAMVIFAVMVPATLGVVTKTTQGVQQNRSRVVAAGLAASQIEKVRATAASALALSDSSTDIPVGNVTYTVSQSITLTNVDGVSADCSVGASVVYYALARVTVTWTNAASAQASTSADTLLRATSAGKGAVAVTVRGSSGQIVTNLPVMLSNGTTVKTNANGCALFLNVTPSAATTPATTYTAKLDSSGYVGIGGTQSSTSPPFVVPANVLTPITMTYDLAMSLTVNYTKADGSGLTAAQVSEIPSEFRSGAVVSSTVTTPVALPGSIMNTLYPAAVAVKSFTGNTCTLGSKDMSSGTPSSQTLGIPTATVGITNFTTALAIGDIKAIYQGPVAGSGITCPVGTTFNIGYVFSIFGDHSAQLPLGNWRLQYPWNPIGFLPIPGLTVFCSDVSLSLTSNNPLLVNVGNLISAVINGLFTGGGCT